MNKVSPNARRSSTSPAGLCKFQDVTLLHNALASMRLFQGCSRHHLLATADEADRLELEPGEQLVLEDGGPLVVVESGAVSVRVGGDGSPAVVFGPGEAFNFVGMLMLNSEVEPFRPIDWGQKKLGRAASSKKKDLDGRPGKIFGGAYDSSALQHVPFLFQESRRRKREAKMVSSIEKGEVSPDDALCFYNLCPNAASRATPPTLNGWLPMTLEGAPPGATPLAGGGEYDSDIGGATVALIPYSLVHRIGYALGDKSESGNELRASLARLQENSQALCDIWRTLISRCHSVFVGVPPEVMWRVAEHSLIQEVRAGDVIVAEGDASESGEALILIDEGMAFVEKRVGEGGRVGSVEIGNLGPGALIGDLCLLGARIPRPATARARTDVQYLVIPSRCQQEVFKLFPGIMEGLEPFVKEVASFLQVRLPTRTAAFGSLELFAGCSQALVTEVAGQSERQIFYAGQVIMSPALRENLLYVLEYGVCGMEASNCGCLGNIATGGCFGDCEVMGTLTGAGSTVRARTPLVVVSVARAQSLKDALRRHCGAEDKWPHAGRRDSLPCGRDPVRMTAGIELFRGCDPEFVQDILAGAQHRGYLPGQTLCVESAQFSHDAAHMFVLRGGQTMSGGDGKPVGEGGSGAGFGELAMLGAEHKRPSTVRALTACFTLEVPRAAFIAAIARHPGEKHHFERFAVQVIQDGGGDDKIKWPFLKQAPARLLYLLNLHAGLRDVPAGEVLLDAAVDDRMESAVLVAQGEVALLSSEGSEVCVFREGDCFNERVLLGVGRDELGDRLVAGTACEVQVLPKEVWDRVILEFPEDREGLCQGIVAHMASQAVQRRNLAEGPVDLIRRSGLLRPSSEQLAGALAERLESQMVLPGDNIMRQGELATRMSILLDGRARSKFSCGTFEYSPGKVFGEAVLLGVTNYYMRTITATTLCMLRTLERVHFQDQTHWTEADLHVMEPLLQESREHIQTDFKADKFEERIRRLSAFSGATPEFLAQICENAEDKFIEPGEVIVAHGDACEFGKTPFFALLAGDAVLENDLGVHLGHIKPGETFGESGALGLSETRTLTVRATLAGSVHCLKFEGAAFKAGIRRFPGERESLENIIDARWNIHAVAARKRSTWIRGKVIPALKAHWLFADSSPEFIAEVAVSLSAADYQPGELIAEAGAPADSMLVLLEGAADVETKSGEKLGSLGAGATVGEVALMGLFPLRLAALRATKPCSVLPVTEKALRRALAEMGTQGVQNAFAELAEQRRLQVQQGLPMTALPMRVSKDNISIRAIALQARRICLAQDQVWDCLPAADPCGEHLGILSSGRAVIEICPPEAPGRRLKVQPLSPGMLLMEDVAAEYGMWLRATSVCEGYRIRMIDFRTAIARSQAAADEWMPHFRMMQVEAADVLRRRGENVRGQLYDCREHHNSAGIRLWKARREKAMARAPKQILPELVHSDSDPCICLVRPKSCMNRNVSGPLPAINAAR